MKFTWINRENSYFVRLHADGSNAHLIDRSKTTTLFVHGYTDSFRPRSNG